MELSTARRQRYRYSLIILRAMVATDFKLRYQASVLGYVWSLLKPLALFTILYLVFANLLKIGASIPHYAVYLLLGIVIWGFFAETTTGGVSSLVMRADLLRKISFPRYVVVLSIGASALVSFGLNMIVIAFFLALARVSHVGRTPLAAASPHRTGRARGLARALPQRPVRALPRHELHLGSSAAGGVLRHADHLPVDHGATGDLRGSCCSTRWRRSSRTLVTSS